jgi:hypothetical protein
VGENFDSDGELKMRVVESGRDSATVWISRRQVVALRDHLNLLIGGPRAESPPFTTVEF